MVVRHKAWFYCFIVLLFSLFLPSFFPSVGGRAGDHKAALVDYPSTHVEVLYDSPTRFNIVEALLL